MNGRYAEPQDADTVLSVGQWHHVAGVFDGSEVRTYVDGQLVAQGAAQGARTMRQLPLIIGADVDGAGNADSPFDGLIDAVRVSTIPRYEGDSFIPSRRWQADGDTALLLNFDGLVGPLAYDESDSQAHARSFGDVELQPIR
ncbi:MAG: LamG domain-containing protein [Planctomycetota bacterium]